MFPFDPPLSPIFSENIKSPLIFWCFQGGGEQKGTLGRNQLLKSWEDLKNIISKDILEKPVF